MRLGDDDLRRLLRTSLRGEGEVPPRGLGRVARRARSLRLQRSLAVAVVAAVVAAGIAVPLSVLSTFGRSVGPNLPGVPGDGTDAAGGAAAAALPTTVEVTCDEEGVSSPTRTVAPRSDGVHLTVTNRTTSRVVVELKWADGGGGAQVRPGRHRLKLGSVPGWPIPPGRLRVGCRVPSSSGTAVPETGVRIADQAGLWVSPRVSCAEQVGFHIESAPAARGMADPVDAVRRQFRGLRPSDVVEPAGYAQGVPRLIRVVRGGEVIARVDLRRERGGGWLLSGGSYCRNAGLEG